MTNEELYMSGYEDGHLEQPRSENSEYLRGFNDYRKEEHYEYIELSREIHRDLGKYATQKEEEA